MSVKNLSPSLHVQLCLLVDSLGHFQIALHSLTITQLFILKFLDSEHANIIQWNVVDSQGAAVKLHNNFYWLSTFSCLEELPHG